MRLRARRRLSAALRLLALGVLALALLMRPVLSSMGEIHELTHDPSGQHLDVDHGRGAGAHDAAKEGREGKSAGVLHAFLHFAHCCGQASFGPPEGPAAGLNPPPPPRIAEVAPVPAATAHWTTPFRPPIAS